MMFPSSSEQSAAAFLGLGLISVTEKLTRSNFQSWRSQVLSAIRGARAAKFIQPGVQAPAEFLAPKTQDSKEDPVANPEHESWVAKDQQVLSYLLSGLSKEILGQVSTEVTALVAWAAIEGICSRPNLGRGSSPQGWHSPPPPRDPPPLGSITPR